MINIDYEKVRIKISDIKHWNICYQIMREDKSGNRYSHNQLFIICENFTLKFYGNSYYCYDSFAKGKIVFEIFNKLEKILEKEIHNVDPI